MVNYVEKATLKVIDHASRPIKDINKNFSDLYKTLSKFPIHGKTVEDSLKRIGTTLGKVTSQTNKLHRVLGGAGRSFISDSYIRNSRVLGESLSKLNKVGPEFSNNLNLISRQLKDVESVSMRTKRSIDRVIDSMMNLRKGGGGKSSSVYSAISTENRPQHSIIDFNLNPLKIWSVSFLYNLGYRIQSSIYQGFTEGTKEISAVRSRLNILGYSKEQQRSFIPIIRNIQKKTGNQLTEAELKDYLADALTITGGNIKAARFILDSSAQFIRSRIALGSTSKEARNDSLSMVKMLDVLDRTIVDDKGNFTAKFAEYYDTLQRGMIVLGKFLNPNQMLTLARNIKATGKSLDQRGIYTLLASADSQGTSAANALNRFVVNLTTTAPKHVRDLQRKIGLRISDGKGGTKAINENLLRQDPAAWAAMYLKPAFAKYLNLDPVKDRAEIERKFADRALVSRFSSEISGRQVSANQTMQMITGISNIEKFVERSLKVQNEKERAATAAASGLTSLKAASIGLQQLFGTIGDILLDTFSPALNMLANGFIKISQFISGNDSDGPGPHSPIARLATIVMGTALVGGAAVKGINALAGKFFPFFRGVMVFNTASNTLLQAARMLLGESVMGGLDSMGGLGGGKGKKGGRIPKIPRTKGGGKLNKLSNLKKLASATASKVPGAIKSVGAGAIIYTSGEVGATAIESGMNNLANRYEKEGRPEASSYARDGGAVMGNVTRYSAMGASLTAGTPIFWAGAAGGAAYGLYESREQLAHLAAGAYKGVHDGLLSAWEFISNKAKSVVSGPDEKAKQDAANKEIPIALNDDRINAFWDRGEEVLRKIHDDRAARCLDVYGTMSRINGGITPYGGNY